MLLNLCTITLLFLSDTNRRCATLPRMSARAYGSIQRYRDCFIKKICFSSFTLLGTVLLVALGLVTSREGGSVVNLEGVQGVRSNSPQDQNYFIFIGNLKKFV